MKRVVAALRAGFGYFSILPVAGNQSEAPDAAALVALPIVGATLGAVAGALGLGAARLVPQPVAASVALGAGIVLSGAVHLDGFLDGCDAFFASVPVERRLDILKDPHHGTFALAGLVVVTSVCAASLAVLPPRRYPLVLAFSGGLARAAIVPCALRFPDARGVGAGPAFALPRAPWVLGMQGALLFLAAAQLARRATLMVPVAFVGAVAIERWCATQLGGGLVGDAYGFGIVVLEAALLAALAAVLT